MPAIPFNDLAARHWRFAWPAFLRYLPGMSEKKKNGMIEDKKNDGKDARERRLAEQLRANLQRRKAQVRARRSGEADETEGLPASPRKEGTGKDGKSES